MTHIEDVDKNITLTILKKHKGFILCNNQKFYKKIKLGERYGQGAIWCSFLDEKCYFFNSYPSITGTIKTDKSIITYNEITDVTEIEAIKEMLNNLK